MCFHECVIIFNLEIFKMSEKKEIQTKTINQLEVSKKAVLKRIADNLKSQKKKIKCLNLLAATHLILQLVDHLVEHIVHT